MSDKARGKRRWLRRGFGCFGLLIVIVLISFTALGGWGVIAGLRGPSKPYDVRALPPAPDYARAGAWLALPGRNGLERSTPPGVTAIDERAAPADVFFVHPTTYKGSPVWIAPFDASEDTAPLNGPVLLGQVSVFNSCCRLYAPHYRQATLAALKVPAAMDGAYSDIGAAFRYYIAHLNHGRPFIIASHSQGTAHAIELLQREILGTPLQHRLVAAYLIGGYVPDNFGTVGLPTCVSARQTGCVISYNTSERGRTGAQMITSNKVYWWRGARTMQGRSNALCVNPLSWQPMAAAPASANPGSLPFPTGPFGTSAKPLPPLVPNLTGAQCHDHLLDVEVPWSAPSGFIDRLSLIFGSYHLNDYGLFYATLRGNAETRVAAWKMANEKR